MNSSKTLEGKAMPFVSIVMPIRNEASSIDECLHRLTSQTYPKDRYDIIVVDGMSEDATRDIVRRHVVNPSEKSGPSIRLVDNPQRSIYPALNLGIRAAKGEIIMRVDGRCVCPLDYIERCVGTLEDAHADNVGGMQIPLGKNLGQRAIALAMSHPFGAGNAQYRVGRKSGYVDAIYLGCFRKEMLDKIGLFDESVPVLSEDSDINQRIREAGGKTYLNYDIKVGYYPRDTIRALCRIYFIWGKARGGFFRKHRTLTSVRQLVPPLFLVSVFLLTLLALLSEVFMIYWALLLGTYLSSDVAVSGYLAFRERDIRLLPRLLVAFPCMHFGWSLGFLIEILFLSKGEGLSWR